MPVSSYSAECDGILYTVTPAWDNSTGGGFARTSTETKYTIVPTVGNLSAIGTVAGADKVFRYVLANFWSRDTDGNPLKEAEVREVEDSNGRLFEGTARFEQEERDETKTEEGVEFGVWPSSFTTTGGTARVVRSYGTNAYPVNGSAPQFDNMIGWNGEEFEGVDAIVPAFSFELSRVTDESFIRNFGQFANFIAQYVGSVNSAPFMGFQKGNVLFNGITSGSLQKQAATETADAYNYWTLNYSFTASPTSTFTVGGATITKRGWDYLWYLTEKSYDQTTGIVAPVIRAAYVEQVYPYADFSGLGLGYNW